MGPSVGYNMEELDEQLQKITQDVSELQIEVENLSDEQLDEAEHLIEDALSNENYKQYLENSDYEPAFEEFQELNNTSEGTEVSVPEQIIFTSQTLSLLLEEMITDAGNRLVISMMVAHAIIPVIAQDATISTYEDILGRVYWSVLVVHWVLNTESD
ncbi:hypothetical protein G9C85_00120 [Halorubellus sp. JP-L1]|uniref:hypothetical protein n=1 Tax=Halorubellus sp. JP-L1 TaxID=2715753 RepID=UPI00140CBE2B|nr:hypothetical protein [Halorubellus sp. JP-L1]NHN40043.1 hypothetical protein [Halorubellus sp. JP-L1]